MSTQPILTPDDFVVLTGEDPSDWPERFAPGTYAKVVTHSEGLWTRVTEDDGQTIRATMANNPLGDFAEFGDPVEFTRANVRDIKHPSGA